MFKSDLVVVGAGPAGLAAALAARSVGMAVIVFEKNNDVGCRFHGDYQGLENWTTDVDVLDELEYLGIKPGFEAVPVYEIVCFDHKGTGYPTSSRTPIFYLVRRGSVNGALDRGLKDQVLNAGITIRFGQPLHHCNGPMIVALAGVREKLCYSNIPEGPQSTGITFVILGLMAMSFMGLSGIRL